MSNKENFLQAFKELTGFDEEQQHGSIAVRGSKAPAERVKAADQAVNLTDQGGEKNLSKTVPAVPKTESTGIRAPERAPMQTENGTYITENMKVKGEVISAANIELFGRIDGNVETKGSFVSTGTVVGNVKADSVLLTKNSAVKGDIHSLASVVVEADAVIIGSITAKSVKLDGKVKGNLFVEEMTELTENALISGNIETTCISTSHGSRIRGSIITKLVGNTEYDAEFEIEV